MDSFDQEASERARKITPIVLTVQEACLVLRVSKGMLYKLIRAGHLETVRMGRRRYVPSASIQSLIERLKEKEGSGGTAARQW